MKTKPTTRADLARLVPAGGTIIELGVAAGEFAEVMLASNSTTQYVGIDRWSDHHDEREMQSAMVKLWPWRDRAGLRRMTFADALPSFPDESVHLIYVDGYAHTGQEDGQTLRDWWPKVNPGGIFAGHDYDAERYPQTVDAVDAFAAEHGLADELRIIDELPHPSWWIRKPGAG